MNGRSEDGWLETYRGTVFRWEVDNVDHFTVAYYMGRFADAAASALESLGLGLRYTERERRVCVTADCYIRYHHELRMNDIMHVATGVIGVERDALVLGHKLFDSENGTLCTTVEHTLRHVDRTTYAAVPLPDPARATAEARRVAWDGPARERRSRPRTLDGFRDTTRDTVKAWEMDALGGMSLIDYVHRFSAANAHALADFGMTPAYMRDEHRGFSTFEFQLAFGAPLGAGDLVVVKSAIGHIGSSSVRILHVMLNDTSGAEVASLEQFGVHLDLDARRPVPLPDALRDKARALLVATT